MKIKPELVVDYAANVQRLEIDAERAQKVADELERLVAGMYTVGAPAVTDDPADFLAALSELRDRDEADR